MEIQNAANFTVIYVRFVNIRSSCLRRRCRGFGASTGIITAGTYSGTAYSAPLSQEPVSMDFTIGPSGAITGTALGYDYRNGQISGSILSPGASTITINVNGTPIANAGILSSTDGGGISGMVVQTSDTQNSLYFECIPQNSSSKFAGSYTGQLTGFENSTLNASINNEGVITATVTPTGSSTPQTWTGTVSDDGTVAFQIAGGSIVIINGISALSPSGQIYINLAISYSNNNLLEGANIILTPSKGL